MYQGNIEDIISHPLKENEWDCEKCNFRNQFSMHEPLSYMCKQCVEINKVVKDLMREMTN